MAQSEAKEAVLLQLTILDTGAESYRYEVRTHLKDGTRKFHGDLLLLALTALGNAASDEPT
jgi:hypothetical protein